LDRGSLTSSAKSILTQLFHRGFLFPCATHKKNSHPFDLVGGVPRNQNWAANDVLFFPNEHLKKALLERTNLQYVDLTVADLTKFNENHSDSRSITFLSSFFAKVPEPHFF